MWHYLVIIWVQDNWKSSSNYFFPIERQRHTHRERQAKQGAPTCQLSLQMPAVPGLGQATSRSAELHLGLPLGWQGHNCWIHHLLPPKVHISSKLECGGEPGLGPRPSDVGCGFPTGALPLQVSNYKWLATVSLIVIAGVGPTWVHI